MVLEFHADSSFEGTAEGTIEGTAGRWVSAEAMDSDAMPNRPMLSANAFFSDTDPRSIRLDLTADAMAGFLVSNPS
jgi:hypothetical protein